MDFDGVVTTKFADLPRTQFEFDPHCLSTLQKVIQLIKQRYPVVNIVITSDWRYDLTREELEILCGGQVEKAEYLDNDVTGMFDQAWVSMDESSQINYVLILEEPDEKPIAIRKFVEKYQLPYESYIIFDDDDLDNPSQIRTRSGEGLRDAEYILYVVSRYLNR